VVKKTVAAKKSSIKGKAAQARRKAVHNKVVSVDMERLVELDLMRTTEAAALNVYQWLGKGDPQAAHRAAVDAIRGSMDLTSVSGSVVFGDGLKPQPGGIATGEKLGNWQAGSLKMDIVLVPIDGIDLVAHGFCGAVSFMAAACRQGKQSAFMKVPCKYMMKIAYGPAVRKGPAQVHLDASVRDNLEVIAIKLGKRVQDLNVAVLDRKRHADIVADIRKAGAAARLITDGDIAACLAPSQPNAGIDVYMGIGGAAEAVLAASAVRCLGGDLLAMPAPRDKQEKKKIVDSMGQDGIKKQFCAEDLARGDNILFCATGISDGTILRGIYVNGTTAFTSSVVMRARFNTVRNVRAQHDLSKKTIRLRSAGAEAKL